MGVGSAEEYRLLIAFLQSNSLTRHGGSTRRLPSGAVAVSAAGQLLGVWSFRNRRYHFARSASGPAAHFASSPAEAVAATIGMLERCALRSSAVAASYSAASLPN